MYSILVTGCAGFIGSHLSEKLLEMGNKVIGVDNFDPFYPREIKESNMSGFIDHPRFVFHEIDLRDSHSLEVVSDSIDLVVHLAGKAGVRPSIEDPQGYIDSNILGTQHVLDFMRERNIKKLAFASSSSIYGNAKEVPFEENQRMDWPVSPYAFTKKSCELLNHTYHHLYDMDVLNMRFFTVFGPRQRPDLAIHKFLRLMDQGHSIPLFGDGTTARDYTYVDDTVEGIVCCCKYLFSHEGVYDTLNLGNSTPVLLRELIDVLSKASDIEPEIEYLPMQAGDVQQTYADINHATELVGYHPKTSFGEGIKKFVDWYHKKEIHTEL